MALVLVLSIVVLVTVLVVGFVTRAGSERISSGNYRTASSTRQLADTAVSLVQAQINHATIQGPTKSWASQPGAIRRYNNAGVLELIYRLYSSTSMTTALATDLASDIPPTSWSSSPAIWCDLNSPVTSTNSSGVSVISFPILDPRDPSDLTKTNSIEGFALSSPPGAQTNASLATYQPVPMPVRWLYILQNGEIVTPSGSGKVVTVTGASTANPIVGRIAFWTDDETCKVNLNTAANGTFWDTPRFDYSDERDQAGAGLALYEPTAGEYQRYPGHPATTTLRKVFPSLTLDNLYGLLPRYTRGGSKEATQAITSATSINKKSDRLYTSVSELLFDKSRNPNSILTRQQVESARFFVTAHSRAPELNLFGKPRIAIWPIHSINDAAHRSLIDKLIAFCATANNSIFYFTRSDNTSTTTDIGLSRNKTLLNYLDTLASTSIPGFGGKFSDKYGADERQILTDIFDYVRITNLLDATITSPYAITTFTSANTSALAGRGQVSPSIRSDWDTQGQGRFPRITEATMLLIGLGNGTITATGTAAQAVSNLQGPTYTATTPPNNQVAVQGFFLMSFFTPAMSYPAMEPAFTIKVDGLNNFTLAGTNMGMPSSATAFVSPAVQRYSTYTSVGPGGGIIDFRIMMASRTLGTNNTLTKFPFYSNIINCTYDSLIGLGASNLSISLYNGNSTSSANLIQTYQINFPAQTLKTPLVSATASNRLFGSNSTFQTSFTSARGSDRVDCAFNNFWADGSIVPNSDTAFSMVLSGSWADARLLATSSVPATAFTAHPNSVNLGLGTTRLAYSQRIGSGTEFISATHGKLVAGSADSVADAVSGTPAKPQLVSPTVSNGVTTSGGALGDWDNGVAHQPDGAYNNKTDEGNVYIYTDPGSIPYFEKGQWSYTAVGSTLFSANRQVPSPVVFGSISTGVKAGKPWQTLLFRPGPPNHPGSVTPKDHLWLDLFWMPVAEPYAISEPFSTAGKVNLNYQIIPFTYITRNTALRSVLASEKVAAVPLTAASVYKTVAQSANARIDLNLSDTNGTLRQFKEKFANNDIFKSASEICDIYFVPSNKNWISDSAAQSDWYGSDYAMVGDNTRERPYADVYSRITTKSNVYTVYYTVQVLKNPTTTPSQWDEDKCTVAGEYRGATTLERYIDPNNTSIPDYATDTSSTNLETYYKWRVVSDTQFAP